MTSAMTVSKTTKRTPVPMNGVDTPKLLATIQAVGAQPELAKFRFRANNRWVAGTRSESTMQDFFGAGGEHKHLAATKATGDHPAVLCGADTAPTPVEWLLHALATCLMAGIGNIAAARGIKLNKVEAEDRRRHRSARSARPLQRGAQRLPGHQGLLRDRWRRFARTARADRHAVKGAFGRVRRGHQRRSGVDRREDAGLGLTQRAAALNSAARSSPNLRITTMRDPDVVIIGGGQSGLVMSRSLAAHGIDHVVLERGRIGERWHSERWHSLHLLTTNEFSALPGLPHKGEPEAFMPARAFAEYLDTYAQAMARRSSPASR